MVIIFTTGYAITVIICRNNLAKEQKMIKLESHGLFGLGFTGLGFTDRRPHDAFGNTSWQMVHDEKEHSDWFPERSEFSNKTH